MNFLSALQNGKLLKIKNAFSEFFHSLYFPVYLSLAVVFFWISSWQVLGIFVLSILGACVLLVDKDITPLIPIALFFMMCFRAIAQINFTLLILAITPFVIALILHFVFYPLSKKPFGKLFLPLVFVSIALFCGGLLSPYLEDYTNGIPTALSVGPIILFIYFLFYNYVAPPKDFDIKIYLSFVMVCFGFIACLEFDFAFLIKLILFNGADSKISPILFGQFGWGNTITCATILLLATPFIFYLSIKKEKLALPLIVFLYFSLNIFLTKSDGALVSLIVLIIPTVFFYYKRVPKKMKFPVKTIVFIAILSCIFVAFMLVDRIIELLPSLQKHFLQDTGRSKLYKDAWGVFTRNPIFGGGLGYYNDGIFNPQVSGDGAMLRVFNFHSVLFHVLGTMGIIGVLAYVYYYKIRIQILTEKNTNFNLFSFISFLMFECYAFIDTGEFNAVPLMLTLTIIIVVVELINKNGSTNALPLKSKETILPKLSSF